ncbi:hypothetical protein JCM10207_007624 [Rhodosporidiobolus poonsookiae]
MLILTTGTASHALIALATLAAAQLAQPDPSQLNTALQGAAFPPLPLAQPGLNPEAEWQQLVHHARVEAQRQLEAERREEREDSQPTAPEPVDGKDKFKVVRETFYVPLGGAEVEQKGPVAAAASEAATAASIVGVTAPVQQEEAADIVKTVGKLRTFRPIFTYAIQHPLRFAYRYLLLPLFHLLHYILSTFLAIFLHVLSSALSPLQLALSVLLAPFTSFLSLNYALLPLWSVLIGAVLVGCGIGALAGSVAGGPTRAILDEAAATGARALVWVGVLPKEAHPAFAPAESKAGGFNPEATLEAVPPLVFGSSRANAQAKAKGKQHAALFRSGEMDDELAAGASFRTIPPTLQASQAGETKPRFPTFLHPKKQPRSGGAASGAGEHPDPPSEELDPQLRFGGAPAGKAASGKAGKGGGAGSGWRGRAVDW